MHGVTSPKDSNIYDNDRRLVQTNFPSGKSIINDDADPDIPDDKSKRNFDVKS
jgi:hypothetical protein